MRFPAGVQTEVWFWESDPSPQPRAPLPARQGLRRRDPNAKSRKLKRQTILAVSLDDGALPAGLGDGQLSGALGTFRQIHDLVAQLGIAHLLADARQGLRDVRLFYFAPGGRRSDRRLAGGGEPQSMRIEFEQSRRLRSGVAELEAQLDGGQLGRRPREEHITVAHCMQGAGATEGAADFKTRDRLADM